MLAMTVFLPYRSGARDSYWPQGKAFLMHGSLPWIAGLGQMSQRIGIANHAPEAPARAIALVMPVPEALTLVTLLSPSFTVPNPAVSPRSDACW